MKKSTKAIRYWIVSPNVRNQPSKIQYWRELIKQTHSAIMGWPPNQTKGMKLGRKFAEQIKKDDIVLIARGANAKKEVLACGRVASVATAPHGRSSNLLRAADGTSVPAPQPFGSYRLLDKFVELEDVKRPSFDGVTNQSWAMFELKREQAANGKICSWLDGILRKSKQQSGGSGSKTKLGGTVQVLPTAEPYMVVTKADAKRIEKAEAKLVNEYTFWLAKTHKRHPLPYSLPVDFSVDGVKGHVACDLYDDDERIMIEAKSSTNRHSVRLAIGQLYDYSYLMQQICGKSVRRAMLLPERLDSVMEEFLKSLSIASIWKNGSSFADNMDQTFR